MIIYFLVDLVLNIFETLLSIVTLGMDPVETLPLSIDVPLTTFATTVNDILNVMPWMAVIWQIFLMAITIKVALFLIEWAIFIVRFVRG